MGANESTSENGNNADGTENNDHSLRTEISGSDMAKAGLVPAGIGAAAGIAAAGVLLASLGACASRSETSSNKKTMKAPGRNDRIFRDDFEENP
ncbi:hypothetical protein CRYUN_Cryun29cG0089300 [Craigia yunnanensis]